MRGSPICVICGGHAGAEHRVREMMFGTREWFDYFLCFACGCCQLISQADIVRHYPAEYYAFHQFNHASGARGWLRKLRNAGVFRGTLVGRALEMLAPYPAYGAREWFRRIKIQGQSRILDVGCGSGDLVRDLVEAGFTRAEGIDPFLPDSVLGQLPRGVRKRGLSDVRGEYDVVMLHHVLEHMPGQDDALQHVARLLRPGGSCLIRLPVIPSEAWDRYRENWVQLDAPRHLFIHSRKSLGLVAARAGLKVEHVEYDSTEFQFVGSEQYQRNVALNEPWRGLTRADVRRFRREARRLNRAGRGDQAAFYLRKPAREAEAASRV